MLPHKLQIINIKGDMARVQFISHQFSVFSHAGSHTGQLKNVQRTERPPETEWHRLAKKTPVQVASVLADSEEPRNAKSSQCQYTAKQKQRAVLYVGAQKYYSTLTHMLGALLIEAPFGHCISWPF